MSFVSYILKCVICKKWFVQQIFEKNGLCKKTENETQYFTFIRQYQWIIENDIILFFIHKDLWMCLCNLIMSSLSNNINNDFNMYMFLDKKLKFVWNQRKLVYLKKKRLINNYFMVQ